MIDNPPVQYHDGKFPPQNLDWVELVPLIGPAVAALARYDGVLAAVPNPDVLLAPLTTQEAVLSARIEGTQATMGEVYQFEAGQPAATPERRDDIYEILNYRKAMRHAERMLNELPISLRVVRETHKVLLSGVRGRDKSPGEYRRSANWIGPPGCVIEEARFVPVSADKLDVTMDGWERFVHADEPDLLVQVAIVHAEFEAIHPFLDGNGRLGRMLVPLFLWERGLIGRPMFYISAYFEAHRDAYYDALFEVSRNDDWTGWCRFFLTAVRAQSEDNLAKAKGILELYETMKPRVSETTNSRYAIQALDWIFQYPIFPSSRFVAGSGIPQASARRVLNALTRHDVLSVVRASAGRRPAILMFQDVMDLTEGRGALAAHA
jgi:Fic family protein